MSRDYDVVSCLDVGATSDRLYDHLFHVVSVATRLVHKYRSAVGPSGKCVAIRWQLQLSHFLLTIHETDIIKNIQLFSHYVISGTGDMQMGPQQPNTSDIHHNINRDRGTAWRTHSQHHVSDTVIKSVRQHSQECKDPFSPTTAMCPKSLSPGNPPNTYHQKHSTI